MSKKNKVRCPAANSGEASAWRWWLT